MQTKMAAHAHAQPGERGHHSTRFLFRGQLDKGLSSTKDWGKEFG